MLARPIFFGLTGVSMLLITNFVLLYQAVTISQSMHYPYLARLEKPISWSSYEGIFQWIKANTQPTDVLASGHQTTIYLYTQRRTIRPFVGRPVSLFYGDSGPPLGPMEEMVAFLKAYKARYFVHLPMPAFKAEEPLSEFVRQVQEHYLGWLKPAYIGD